MKKPILFLVLVTIVLLMEVLFPSALAAQPPVPGTPTHTPIDGGLALLAAAGGGYAIKKLRDRKEW